MTPLTIAAVVFLGLVCVCMAYWIISDELKERRRERAEMWASQQAKEVVPVNKHHGHADNAVMVPDLLRRAIASGDPLRLAWQDDDTDAPLMVRGYIKDEYPTAVLPRITDAPAVPLPVLGTEPGLIEYYADHVAGTKA
jgi:hypothetical protein